MINLKQQNNFKTQVLFSFILLFFCNFNFTQAQLKCTKGNCLGKGKVAIFGAEMDGRRDKTSGGKFGSCRNDGKYGNKQDGKDKFVRLNYGNDKQKNINNTPCVAAISTKNYRALGGHKIACKSIAGITIGGKKYQVRIGDNGTSGGFAIEMSATCYREFGLPANNPIASEIVIKKLE